LEESGRGVSEVLSHHLSGEAEKKPEKPQSKYPVSQPAAIRAERLPSMSLERYRCANPLGKLVNNE
jgi:hypothetical protein